MFCVFVLRLLFTEGGGLRKNKPRVGVGPSTAARSTSRTSRRESIKNGTFRLDNISSATPLTIV